MERLKIARENSPITSTLLTLWSQQVLEQSFSLQYGNHYGIDVRIVRPYFFGPGYLPSEMTPVFRTLLGSIEGLDNLYLERPTRDWDLPM